MIMFSQKNLYTVINDVVRKSQGTQTKTGFKSLTNAVNEFSYSIFFAPTSLQEINIQDALEYTESCYDYLLKRLAQSNLIANNEETYNIEELFDTYAIGGVDLSSTTDLTCATLLIVKHNKKYVIQQYFIPSERLEFKIKDDKIPYDKWEKRGLVTICEGAKVNYSDVTQWFLRMNEEYQISAMWIGYDPWSSTYWVEEMEEAGFTMIEVRQGAKTMSNPMKQLEGDLIDKVVNYNNNPILKWCLTNTAVKRDDNDNIRPVKGRQQRARIDGAVSLIIAYCVLFVKMQDYLVLQEE